MTLLVSGKTYEVEDISISTELYVRAADEEEGLQVFKDLSNLQSFTLNGTEYAGLVVSKISLVVVKNDHARVIVRMRPPTQEDVRAQLEELQTIVAPLITDSKTGSSAVKAKLAERFPNLVKQVMSEEVR